MIDWMMVFQGLVATGIVAAAAALIKTMVCMGSLKTWAELHSKQDDERHVQILAAVISSPAKRKRKK